MDQLNLCWTAGAGELLDMTPRLDRSKLIPKH
jgi:hypothetical protein